jgi:hypothetical protein
MSRSRILQDRLSFLGYDGHCQENLKELQTLLAPAIDDLLDDFYQFMRSRPETRDLLPSEEALERARSAHKEHWLQTLFGGELGEAQVAQAIQIGRAHERIGLGLSAYLAGYCMVLNHFVELIAAKYHDDADALSDKTRSIQKAVFLDIDFVIESYLDAKNASIRKILQKAELFIDEIEQIDGDLAALSHHFVPHTEELLASLGHCQKQLAQLEQSLGASPLAQEHMQGLRSAFTACGESAAVVGGQSQQLVQQLNRLHAEVATRNSRHRIKFGPPPPSSSFLSRLKQAVQILFPSTTG